MVEWCDDKRPMHSMEIITLDSKNNLIGGFPVRNHGNPKGLPLRSVGRIYTSNGHSTGFLYSSISHGLIVLSTLHSYRTSFETKPVEFIYIVFDVNHNYDQDKNSSHCRHPIYRKLNPINKNLELHSMQYDPISDCPYSLPNDIMMFEVVDVCVCGRRVSPLKSGGLEIIDYKESMDNKVTLLGYPGLLSPTCSFPLKTELKPEESNMLFNSMKEHQLIWTEGTIDKTGDLIAISNSSAGGMSGSPLLIFSDNKWKAVGLLVGGPAVVGHYHMLKLASFIDNDEKFESIFKEYTELNELKRGCTLKGDFENILYLKNKFPDLLIEQLEFLYYNALRWTYIVITKEKGEIESKAMLNHNLVLPLNDYIEVLNNYQGGTPALNYLKSDMIASETSCCLCVIT